MMSTRPKVLGLVVGLVMGMCVAHRCYALHTQTDPLPLEELDVQSHGLVVLGKPQYSIHQSHTLIQEGLYILDDNQTVRSYLTLGEFPVSRCTIQLEKGSKDALYQVNVRKGVYRIDREGNREIMLPAGTVYHEDNPSVEVYIGLQTDGSQAYGRPVWDATVMDDSIYVVPVVVDPEGGPSYLATARLAVDGSGWVGEPLSCRCTCE